MNYVSGLMLGASVANMLRQMLGAGSTSGFAGQGMGGGHGRAMQDGNLLSGAASLGNFSSGASAFSSLFGSMGRMGGNTPLLHAGVSDKNAVPQRASDPSVSPFAVVHASSGRRRYRTPYLTPEFAKVLEELLPRLPFVTALRANAVSGSILIIYPPEDEAHILVLAEGLEAIFAEGRTAPPPATVAQSVRRSVRDFSGWIQRHTGGALDLSSLVAVIFVLRGIRQLLLTNNTPSGSQMLWWALTLMRGWKV